jgi:hypothetical protein
VAPYWGGLASGLWRGVFSFQILKCFANLTTYYIPFKFLAKLFIKGEAKASHLWMGTLIATILGRRLWRAKSMHNIIQDTHLCGQLQSILPQRVFITKDYLFFNLPPRFITEASSPPSPQPLAARWSENLVSRNGHRRWYISPHLLPQMLQDHERKPMRRM